MSVIGNPQSDQRCPPVERVFRDDEAVTLAPGYRFRWDPELERVSALMRATWGRPCWDYDRDLLDYHLAKPGNGPSLSLGVESEASGALVGYQAHLPVDIELHGVRRRAVLASFLTAAPETRGANLAHSIQVRLLKRAQALNYELYLAMCQVGALSNGSVKKACQAIERPVAKFREIHYYASATASLSSRVSAAASGNVRAFRTGDECAVADLLARNRQRLPLLQIHRREDISHRFSTAENRCTFVVERDGQIRGLMHVLVLSVLDTARQFRNAYVQDYEWTELTSEERLALVGAVVRTLEAKDVEGVLIPDTGALDVSLWKSLSFRMLPRALNVYGAALNDECTGTLTDIDAFSLDVL